jgi:hypothetical protein
VADELMTCANCGHAQATGAFCEACGTKLPAAAAVAGAAAPLAESTPAAAPVPAAAAATPPPPPPPPPSAYAEITGKGFWAKFFDLSFSEFVTPSVIRVLFILFLVLIGLSVIGGVINGFLWSPALGVFALIGGLIGGFVSLILARVFLEIVIVFFHIDENTREIVKSKR